MRKWTYGPLVKRLRHVPFTAVTWVDSRTGHQTKLLIFFDDALKIRSFFITLFASTTIVPHF